MTPDDYIRSMALYQSEATFNPYDAYIVRGEDLPQFKGYIREGAVAACYRSQ